MDFRIISIGTLSRHELWGETAATRTAHATTTLIRSGNRVILVDPSLPPQVIQARLTERCGLQPGDITDVFMTNFRPAHRWGLSAFPQANWLISEMERETTGRYLIARLEQEQQEEAAAMIRQDIQQLQRCQAASDRPADQVDLFPLPGFTAGTCGLLLSHLNATTLLAGDAVGTYEHLIQGRVLQGCADADQGQESLREAIEIADVIVPGHDNLVLNPTRRPM
jgi:glyoxylase-like metal-dependent hydrolase (beta-lactamase superfamily II)